MRTKRTAHKVITGRVQIKYNLRILCRQCCVSARTFLQAFKRDVCYVTGLAPEQFGEASKEKLVKSER